MKEGDRMLYHGEPVYVVDTKKVRARDDSGWVLVQWADGARRYVLPEDLKPVEK